MSVLGISEVFPCDSHDIQVISMSGWDVISPIRFGEDAVFLLVSRVAVVAMESDGSSLTMLLALLSLTRTPWSGLEAELLPLPDAQGPKDYRHFPASLFRW